MTRTLSTLFLALCATSGAQQLYAPAPPANSAFVRVIGAPAATLETQPVTAAKNAASAYVVIPQGSLTAKVGTVGQKFTVVAGKFYSVVLLGGKLSLLTDQAADNKAKALLTVYNLSSAAALDLKTADSKLSVVSGVKPGESGSRAVNGITVDLAAFSGTKTLGTLKAVKLERGNAYAVVVTDVGATLTQSSTK